MCTVTYLPIPSGYALTHNRDEAPARSPDHISRERIGGCFRLFPRDTKAGGAWIIAAQTGQTACLLNGAFLKHRHEPPYRHSRGLVLVDFLNATDTNHFFSSYDLDKIEPFTLLSFQPWAVAEFRWDGQRRHLRHLNPEQAYFWCSATLYPPQMQQAREQVFQNWLSRQKPNSNRLPTDILRLHLKGSVGDPENDFVMNRNGRVCTVSVTQVVCRQRLIRMRYLDLLEGQQDLRQMKLT